MIPAASSAHHPGLPARFAVVVLLVAMLLAYLGRGNWLHQMLSAGFALWVGVPLLLCTCVALLRRAWALAFGCAVIPLAAALQFGLGYGLLQWDIAAAQRECEALLPALDSIHASTGQFPLPEGIRMAAEQFSLDYPHSALLNYYSDATSFTCEVTNPAELFGGFIFSNSERRWTEWRD